MRAITRRIGRSMASRASLPNTQLACAEQSSKGHVLFVSRQRIAGRTNGSSVYLLDLAEAVRRAGFTPHLMQPSPTIMGRWPVMRLHREMSVFETHAIRGVLRLGNCICSLDPTVYVDAVIAAGSRLCQRLGLTGAWATDRPRPYSIAAPWTQADHRYLLKAQKNPDIVIADYAFQSEALVHFPRRPTAIVMHDLFHCRTQANGRDSVASIDREAEIALLSKADAVIAIQMDEARFVAAHVPHVQPILAPFAMRPAAEVQPGLADRLLFVGSNTAPNVVGLEWLFEHVWPGLKARFPAVTLDIAGTVAAAFPQGGPPGVVFHGMVEDLSPFYAGAGIVISPLTFGSGLKIKLVEALAHGKAVVATGVTLQGIEQECADAVIHADTAPAFVDGIVSLIDDDRRLQLARKALQAAHDHFAPKACHAAFVQWLEDSRSDRLPKGASAA